MRVTHRRIGFVTGKDLRMQKFWRYPLIILFLILGTLNQPYVCAAELAEKRRESVKTQEPVLVIIGASYAKDWEIQSTGKYRVVNKGVGGEETHQMRARLEEDVIKQRPSAVLIWGFINDIFRSPREGVTDKLARTRANLQAMITRVNAAGIRPILATEVYITTPNHLSERLLGWVGKLRGKTSYQDYVNAHVRDTNIWIREIAKEKKISILDFERVLADESGARQRRYAAEDGSHLSAEAYAALTDYTNRLIDNRQ